MAGQGESEQGREEVIGYWFIVIRKEVQTHQRCNTISAQSNGLGIRPSPKVNLRAPCMGLAEKAPEATERRSCQQMVIGESQKF